MGALRLGTRASALARWQTAHVVERLRALAPDLAVETVELSSLGDELPEVPIEHMDGVGFFTSTLERALLSGEIDVAVHSFKDLPVEGSPDLIVAAVPPRAPAEDALCGRDRLAFAALPAGARVGTSSARRTAQLRALRPDLACVPLRGNVPTRLERVARGELDAVVLARAGLERLGLAAHITEIFPLSRVLPAPAQGALAVQARAADVALVRRLGALDDGEARRAIAAERALLHALGGGCSVPVGAHATASGARVALEAAVFDLDGGPAVRARVEAADAARAGIEAARRLLAAGAGTILAAFAKQPRVAEER
ncbi:MAG: hydroxymethylbilane synthase [Candidatus Eisenbacteria bacterium]|nr:hydroxymethylbilane synthase [Candidatus Eisenbacteria bacterium]